MDDVPPSNHELISEISKHYEKLLGSSVKDTRLEILNKNQWVPLCDRYNLNKNSSGIYLPRNQTAIIPTESKLSLFHEYFGHGLFCEQSLAGKRLIDLEKKLLEEEKREFEKKKFTLKDIEKFRKENKTFLDLENFKEKNLKLYEEFAIFSEYVLSKEFNLNDLFKRRYDSLSKQDKEDIENVIDFNKNYGDLATFYNFGLARRTNVERAKRLLEQVYNDKSRIKLAMLYGSKKEFSDIDIFIVSDSLIPLESSWLDIRIENVKNFEEMVRHFDASMIGPILNSEYLLGDKDYLEEKKKQIKKQPISKETIIYNIKKSEEQKNLALSYPKDSEERKHGFDYVNSYLTNARALQNGFKILTEKELKSFSQKEKFIELEGGKL
jgi:hypothetical protein